MCVAAAITTRFSSHFVQVTRIAIGEIISKVDIDHRNDGMRLVRAARLFDRRNTNESPWRISQRACDVVRRRRRGREGRSS
jgi:hypothetical protein